MSTRGFPLELALSVCPSAASLARRSKYSFYRFSDSASFTASYSLCFQVLPPYIMVLNSSIMATNFGYSTDARIQFRHTKFSESYRYTRWHIRNMSSASIFSTMRKSSSFWSSCSTYRWKIA